MDLDGIKLTDEQKKKLALLAAKQGKTWQQVVDEFLTRGPREERNDSVLDAAIRLGVAGSVVGGPDDLPRRTTWDSPDLYARFSFQCLSLQRWNGTGSAADNIGIAEHTSTRELLASFIDTVFAQLPSGASRLDFSLRRGFKADCS